MRGKAEPMDFKTADLCDEFEQSVGVAEPLLRDYGGTKSFYGSLATVKVFEDNVLVREAGRGLSSTVAFAIRTRSPASPSG
jgi:regulator of RNase E activity RraA